MSLDRRAMERALPSYEIGPELGRGAFGIVYSGRHRTLGREVAIKQLPRAFSSDPDMSRRFLTEARVVASFDHPHIVPVYDYVEHEGLRLLVMEGLRDGTLVERARARSEDGSPGVDWACAVAIAVALGLQHAHERGVLHRDVKPENVLFAGDTPKLADFGIAKGTNEDAHLTATGTVIGTVAYMSPEQASGEKLGPPSDVYSCAIVLYELLAKRLPFPPLASMTGQLLQHLTAAPEELSVTAPGVPAEVASVIMGSLAKRPEERPSTAAEFAVSLDQACRSVFGGRWLARSGVRVIGLDGTAENVRARTMVNEAARAPATEPAVLDSGPEKAQVVDTAGRAVPAPSTDTISRPAAAGVTADRSVTGASPPVAAAVASEGSTAGAPPEVPRAPVTETRPVAPSKTAPPRRRLVVVLAACLAVIVAVGVGAFAIGSGGGKDGPGEALGPSSTAAPRDPTTLAPTTLPATTLAPATLAPTTAPATTLAPTTLAPTTLAPTTLAPTTLAPTTLAPTTPPPTKPPETVVVVVTVLVTQPSAAPTAPPTAPATTPATTRPKTKAASARQSALTALQRSCLAAGMSDERCGCVVAGTTSFNVAQITAFVRAVNGRVGFSPKARSILNGCGVTQNPSGAKA